MNKYDILEYGFACFYIFAISTISFAVGAGIMWFFHDLLGASPYWITGMMGVVYGFSYAFWCFDRLESKSYDIRKAGKYDASR